LGKSGPISTSSALAGKTGVFVYFSAHWCPPCRGFTPKLVEFHTKHAATKGFETVFVSGDRDQKSFEDYYGEMPWLALPYEKKDLSRALNKKYKVKGIPSLVILGPDGRLITADGRGKIMEHFDDCAGYPWVPKSLGELLSGPFLKKDDTTVGSEAIEGKTLGLYFSAHWCPPCRGFTPQLKTFYEEYKALDPNFEIVFVSSDKDEQSMLDYFKNDHGDYLALPFAKRAEKDEISKMFDVDGIPSFAVIGPDGHILNANARGKISGGAGGVMASGWEPPAVGDMAEGPEAAGTDINEAPAIVILCNGASLDEQKAIEAAVEPLARSYIAEGKRTGDGPKYIFLLAKGGDGGAVGQLKALTRKDAGDAMAAAGDKPVMLLFDIPDNGGFYLSENHDITTESVAAFLKARDDGSLTRMQLARS